MDNDEKDIKEIKKHNKLYKAYKNNTIISDMNLLDKFNHFEDSKLDESKTLLYEVTKKPKCFKRYSRGSIVRVKFGVNIGSEFSGDHFAIVISKKDTMMSSTLHVIPITSKKHLKNIYIGNILYSQDQIDLFEKELESNIEEKEKKKINVCLKYYKKRKELDSYACIDHIKTISKISICKLINKYDYLPNLKVSSEQMKVLDNEIIREYTL